MSNSGAAGLRLVLGFVVLATLVVFAVRGGDNRRSETTVAEVAPLSPPPAMPATEWAVGVDGWRIEVDGVVVDRTALSGAGMADGEWGDLRLDRLALYADSIGTYADEESIDWRLVAAVISVESAFMPGALSTAGAFGLMQVKEEAAREVGVFPYDDPDSNIKAGVRYLAAMRAAFPGATSPDRTAMMLAAYNMGPGHLRDARALAADLGYPPLSWEGSVASVVPLMEQPAVYEELAYGFAQGRSVVEYVDRVMDLHGAYRRRFPAVMMPSVGMIADIASR